MKTSAAKFCLLGVTALSCLLMTGCLDIQLRLLMREDGSGVATWNIEIPAETASLGMNAASLRAEIEKDSQFRRPGVEIREGRSQNGNQTLEILAPFQNVAEVSSGGIDVLFERRPDSRTCLFRLSGGSAQMAMMRMQAQVEMPGRIVRSNADRVAGNVAYFDSVYRPDGAWAEAELSRFDLRTLATIAAGVVLALLVASAGWLMWLRRQGVKAAAPTADRAALSAPPEPLICRECGMENRAGWKFCKRCGAPLDA